MRLIKADDVIKSLMDMTYYDDEGHTIHDYKDRLAIVKGFVDSVPTVDAEPVRHGRYIHDKVRILDDDTGDEPIFAEEDRYTCSECGKKYLRFAPDYNYCPECGAKMDGAEREEE